MRGNRAAAERDRTGERSIPACAGEPLVARRQQLPAPVYPRVCGGTYIRRATTYGARGLSPRVRGNQELAPVAAQIQRSIPACAGEPRRWSCPRRRRTVYPRVCGGTPRTTGQPVKAHGLSPRVRGNLNDAEPGGSIEGSIPACAGEPHSGSPGGIASTVYPRVCGGTPASRFTSPVTTGLSPRVRGNRPRVRTARACGRSIPACAGEPSAPPPPTNASMVYPRVCGGTTPAEPTHDAPHGLSPRVRGNPA